MFYNIPSIAYNIFELIENKNKDRNILYDIFDAKFFTKDTKDTFNRWKEVLKEFNKFYDFEDNKFYIFEIENNKDINLISCYDIKINSLCSHHLFPYSCKIDIEYIPNKVYCGLSELPFVADHYSKRPCTQEELVANIYNYLYKKLNPSYLKVIAKDGLHTCCSTIGAKKEVNYIVKKQSKGEIK
jgi:GTP cyclohydrolase I